MKFGIIIEGYGRNNSIETIDGSIFIISNFEPIEIINLPLGTEVTFNGSYPGDGRGVAKNVKIKESKWNSMILFGY